ncbi:hypothetical protein CRE_06489 [Caenorhabditis remanei]|uniref:Uncharacterized protein n=1 Tax=Caenorhabditis remanei TaxID=31234 RepID=E3M119_CAERE|nr:hypothetical protein CRE_06489 [Caenorhabditis remanei]
MQHFAQDGNGQANQVHQGQVGNNGMDWQAMPAQGAIPDQGAVRHEGGGHARNDHGGRLQAGRAWAPYQPPHQPTAEDFAIWRQNNRIMREREAQHRAIARQHQEQMARIGNPQMNQREEQIFPRQGAQGQEAGAGQLAAPLLRHALVGEREVQLPPQAGAPQQPPQQQQQQHHRQQQQIQQQVPQPHYPPQAGFVFNQQHHSQRYQPQHQQPDIRQHQQTPFPQYFNQQQQQQQPLPHAQAMARNDLDHAVFHHPQQNQPLPQQQQPQPLTPHQPALPSHTPSPQNAIDDDLLKRLQIMNAEMREMSNKLVKYEADKLISDQIMKRKDEYIKELSAEVGRLKMEHARIIPPATNTVGTEMSPPPTLLSTSTPTQTTSPPPSTFLPSTSSVSPPPPPRSPIHIKQEEPEVVIEEGEIIVDRILPPPDKDTMEVVVVGCAVVLPEERRRFVSHREAVQFWEANFGGWQNPGVERNRALNLNEYLFNPEGGEATPQVVKKPCNSANFYQNQRPARRGYPNWTTKSTRSKKRWLEMWMEVRKQQDLQVRSGLIVFRADVEAGRVKMEQVAN